jgi:hypothetical protein
MLAVAVCNDANVTGVLSGIMGESETFIAALAVARWLLQVLAKLGSSISLQHLWVVHQRGSQLCLSLPSLDGCILCTAVPVLQLAGFLHAAGIKTQLLRQELCLSMRVVAAGGVCRRCLHRVERKQSRKRPEFCVFDCQCTQPLALCTAGRVCTGSVSGMRGIWAGACSSCAHVLAAMPCMPQQPGHLLAYALILHMH